MKKELKKFALKIFALVLCTLVAVASFVSCGKENEGAIVYKNPDGKVTSVLDTSFLSFWIAVQNNQYASYISAFDAAQGWDTVVEKESGKTLRDVMLEEAVRTASSMLQAEYIHDHVCGIDFTDTQADSVNEYISSLVSTFGSEKNLETELSSYGASIGALEKYMTLMLKYETLYGYLYSEGGEREITPDMKKAYFEENYAIADHILFDMRGIQKDDGTIVGLTEEQEKEIWQKAEGVYSAIKAGVMTFEEAKEQYNEDYYASEYPFGYFVTDDNTFWSEFQTAALEMQEGEIRLVRTYAGAHIMLKKPMNGELYMSNGDFNDSLSTVLSGEDYVALLETVSDGVEVSDALVSRLDPALVKPFAFGNS